MNTFFTSLTGLLQTGGQIYLADRQASATAKAAAAAQIQASQERTLQAQLSSSTFKTVVVVGAFLLVGVYFVRSKRRRKG